MEITDKMKSDLAKRIKELRESIFFSQESLAEAADLSASAIKKIEQGKRWPTPKTVSKIAEALGVSTQMLYSGKTDPFEEMEKEYTEEANRQELINRALENRIKSLEEENKNLKEKLEIFSTLKPEIKEALVGADKATLDSVMDVIRSCSKKLQKKEVI